MPETFGRLFIEFTKDLLLGVSASMSMTATIIGIGYWTAHKIQQKMTENKETKKTQHKPDKPAVDTEVLIKQKEEKLNQYIDNLDITAIDNINLEGVDRHMLNQLKTFIEKHIQTMNQKINQLEEQDTKNERVEKNISYAQGSKDFATAMLKEIETLSAPIWSVTEEDLKDNLRNMDILDDMNEEDYERLMETAYIDFNMSYDELDSDLDEFINASLLKINPNKYGIYQTGALVRIKDNLIINKDYGGKIYTAYMNQLNGRTAVIDSVVDDHTFKLNIDTSDKNEWTKEMVYLLQNP